MLGVHEIIVSEIDGLLTGTGESMRTAVKDCPSATVLKAARALVSLGAIHDGFPKGQPLTTVWIGKKANKAIDRRIRELDSLYDEDEVLTAVESDLTNGGKGLLLPDGFDVPEEWVREDLKGLGVEETKERARESISDLRARVNAMIEADEIAREEDPNSVPTVNRKTIKDLIEKEMDDGERAGALRFLFSKVKEFERRELKAVKALAKKVQKGIRIMKAEEEKRDRQSSGQFFGLYELPEVGEDLIDLEADRECPKCGQVKPVGEGFGLRRMKKVVYHDTGDTLSEDHEDEAMRGRSVYVKAVYTVVRNQSQCKKCRARKKDQ